MKIGITQIILGNMSLEDTLTVCARTLATKPWSWSLPRART